MPDAFRDRMLNNIVGFRIPISRIEGKFKISQNRNATERANVHNAMASGSPDEQELARWMQRLNLVP
jgi:transcriptional regulator